MEPDRIVFMRTRRLSPVNPGPDVCLRAVRKMLWGSVLVRLVIDSGVGGPEHKALFIRNVLQV